MSFTTTWPGTDPDPLPPPLIERTIGRYLVGPKLGEGGMGEVVLAIDPVLGREVAIKRMRTRSSASRARFVREACVQARLDHPAIVPVYELSEDATGRPYLVMKRLSGQTLAELLDSGDATLQRMLRAFVEVCRAIELAHARGIVHRDLKPANIMLGALGEVYVLDWGVALLGDEPAAPLDTPVRDDLTGVGAALGTPGYIAPEQIEDAPSSGPAADVYSLGCILFEILAGRRLHPSGLAGLESATRADIDARPSQHAPDREVAPELDALCAHATAFEPRARPSAHELACAVERYLDGNRDVQLRRQLARTHLARARAELARGGTDARQAAMAEAGRALALDPRNAEVATLVGRLVLEPPPTTPLAVERAITEDEHATLRANARLGTLGLLGHLPFVPLLVWSGLRDLRYLAVLLLLFGAGAAILWHAQRLRRVTLPWVIAAAVANAFVIALCARMFSPFIVTPAIAVTTAMMFALNPRRLEAWIACALVTCGLIVPWLLEVTGVAPPTIMSVDGELVIRTAAISARAPAAQIVLAIQAVALLVFGAAVVRSLARAQSGARRTLRTHAWHLHQLVQLPSSTPRPDTLS